MALAAMGYNARNDEIRDNITRMRREWAGHWQPCAAYLALCDAAFLAWSER